MILSDVVGYFRSWFVRNHFTGKGILRAGSGRRSLNSPTLYGNKKG